jgi:hypothetical protein
VSHPAPSPVSYPEPGPDPKPESPGPDTATPERAEPESETAPEPAAPEQNPDVEEAREDIETSEPDSLVEPSQESRYPQRVRHAPNYYRPCIRFLVFML